MAGVASIFWGLETILKYSNTKRFTILPETSVYTNTHVPEKMIAHVDTWRNVKEVLFRNYRLGVLHNDRFITQLTCSHLNRNLFYRRAGTVCV